MYKDEVIKAIRKAKELYVYASVVGGAGCYFRASKSDATESLSVFSDDVKLKVRVDSSGDVYIN